MPKTTQNIYLIGFMGSGKSYLGQELAKALNWAFLDIDAFLEEEEKRRIACIFAESGESFFRTLERHYLHRSSAFHKTVIATGGGAPCFFDNMDWMNANGLTIYLKTPIPILIERLRAETNHRPLLAQKTSSELAKFINQKLGERTPFYEKAQYLFEYKTGKEGGKELLLSLEKNLILTNKSERMKIYHNPRCSKSRETLTLLKSKGIQPEIVLYLDNPPTEEELQNIVNQLNIQPSQLVRKREKLYKELFKDKNLSEAEWLGILAKHPKLIERPIVLKDGKAVLGRPPEKALDLI